jgi:hypothetical protein
MSDERRELRKGMYRGVYPVFGRMRTGHWGASSSSRRICAPGECEGLARIHQTQRVLVEIVSQREESVTGNESS